VKKVSLKPRELVDEKDKTSSRRKEEKSEAQLLPSALTLSLLVFLGL